MKAFQGIVLILVGFFLASCAHTGQGVIEKREPANTVLNERSYLYYLCEKVSGSVVSKCQSYSKYRMDYCSRSNDCRMWENKKIVNGLSMNALTVELCTSYTNFNTPERANCFDYAAKQLAIPQNIQETCTQVKSNDAIADCYQNYLFELDRQQIDTSLPAI